MFEMPLGVFFIGRIPGNVSQVDLQISHWHPEFVAVNKEANDYIVHLNRLGKAERLACQSLNTRT